MSQTALFIGGPWDGKRRVLSPQEEDRNVIQVAALWPVPVYSPISESVATEIVFYRYRAMAPETRVRVYAPDAMDDRQMLLTLFDGYRRPAKEEGEQ